MQDNYDYYRIHMGDKGAFLVLAAKGTHTQEIRDWLDFQAIDYADVRLVENPPKVVHYSNVTRKTVDRFLAMGVE